MTPSAFHAFVIVFMLNKKGSHGPWLKAETSDHSPYWDAFYGKLEELVVEETLPVPSSEPGEGKSPEQEPTTDMQLVVCSKKRPERCSEQMTHPAKDPLYTHPLILERGWHYGNYWEPSNLQLLFPGSFMKQKYKPFLLSDQITAP